MKISNPICGTCKQFRAIKGAVLVGMLSQARTVLVGLMCRV
jgi:hypothetical protein